MNDLETYHASILGKFHKLKKVKLDEAYREILKLNGGELIAMRNASQAKWLQGMLLKKLKASKGHGFGEWWERKKDKPFGKWTVANYIKLYESNDYEAIKGKKVSELYKVDRETEGKTQSEKRKQSDKTPKKKKHPASKLSDMVTKEINSFANTKVLKPQEVEIWRKHLGLIIKDATEALALFETETGDLKVAI